MTNKEKPYTLRKELPVDGVPARRYDSGKAKWDRRTNPQGFLTDCVEIT